jgi:hypothetical protein
LLEALRTAFSEPFPYDVSERAVFLTVLRRFLAKLKIILLKLISIFKLYKIKAKV